MSLATKINKGQFVILTELEPPKGSDFTNLIHHANRVRGRIDAIMVPEMANGVMKASSLGGCGYLQMHGFETILQICCRDRNRLALQADILSAAALGVPNIMAIEGENIRYGDHPESHVVNDLDLNQILKMIQQLQKGKDLAGIELQSSPIFFKGSLINAGANGDALVSEIANLAMMVNAGIQFAITTPVFDINQFKEFSKNINQHQIAIIPSVLLLKSAGMARYIDRNIKNIHIPANIIKDLQKAPDKIKKSVQIASELILNLKEMKTAGVMISTLGWEEKLPLILDEIKK